MIDHIGDTNEMVFSDDDLKRFERSFQKTGSNTYGCWEWTAVIGSNGYGRFWCKGKLWLAHRFAWVLSGREIPEGLVMDHICRNRKGTYRF